MKILQPPNWAKPRGYVNGLAVETGRLVFISGQIGWNAACEFETDDFAEQAKQALENVLAVLAEAEGKPEHIMRMTWYVVDKQEYMNSYKRLGQAYRELMGGHYPAMTAVQVEALIEDRAKVEIEVTAVIPNSSRMV